MKKTAFPNAIEALESRIAPAGLVLTDYNPSTGVLTLTGNGDANSVLISKIGASKFRIEGVATEGVLPGELLPTFIDGKPFLDVNRITAIEFAMQGGDDHVELRSLGWLRSVDFHGGTGSDTFLAENLKTRRDVTFDFGDGDDAAVLDGVATVIGGNLHVDANTGGSHVQLLAGKNVVRGKLSGSGGTGEDRLTLGHNSALTVGRGIEYQGDALLLNTTQAITIGKSEFGRSVWFQGEALDGNVVSIAGSRVILSGAVFSFTASATYLGSYPIEGTDAWSAPSKLLKIGRDPIDVSLYVGGNNGDTVLALEGERVDVGGSIHFSGGDGNDRLISERSGRVTIGREVNFDADGRVSIDFNGDDGNDSLSIHSGSLTTTGNIRMKGGNGNDSLTLGSHETNIGKGGRVGFSVNFEGGSGADEVNLGGTTMNVKGYVNVLGEDGADRLLLNAAKARFGASENLYSILFSGGDGDNGMDVDSQDIKAAGYLGFATPMQISGTDTMRIRSGSLTALGLEFGGGPGDDVMDVEVRKLSLGYFDFHGDAGEESVSLAANGVIKKAASFDFGDEFTEENEFGELTARGLSPTPGALKFRGMTGVGGDVVLTGITTGVFPTGDLERVVISNVTFGNFTSIRTDNGDSYVALDRVNARDKLFVVTGGGEDVVEIERDIHAGPSTFRKILSVDLGTGNDILRIGNSLADAAHRRARLLGGLEIDGGDGTDTRNFDLLTGANVIAGTPVIQSVEELDV